MPDHYSLLMPCPPSLNNVYSQGRNGRRYKIPEAKAYTAEVQAIAERHGLVPLEGEVALVLHIYRPRQAGDLSNRIKILEDALRGYAYHDDEQVKVILATGHDDKENPRAEVDVWTTEAWLASSEVEDVDSDSTDVLS